MSYTISKPYPLGASLQEDGVNFSVFAPFALSVELLLFDSIEDNKPRIITLDSTKNKSHIYWHTFVENLSVGQLYGYRVHGAYEPEKGHWFDGTKVLVDPYAKCIVGEYDREKANIFGESNLTNCLKSAVIDDTYDWEQVEKPFHSLAETIIYELHPAGFTRDESSGVESELKGTYTGLIEKIPYLKSLGITAIEMLPVFAYDKHDAPVGRKNYWGYSPINFFAPHSDYSSFTEPQAIVNEFKDMVKALHKADIEIILDVVYNHTTENDGWATGPTLCHRGFANSSYYLIDKKGKFKDFTGTGNSINGNHSVVRRMITDSLLYWTKEMKVDGYRFDLAAILARSEDGTIIKNPPILWSIDSDPHLANTKILAEPWDASGTNQIKNFTGDRWVIWNDHFRNTMRKFVNGEKDVIENLANRIMGSPNLLTKEFLKTSPNHSLNFITCHDGFTLRDLVSYNKKHNEANGEFNRDGSNQNFSSNYGIEGETADKDIQQIRTQQQRNFWTLLMLSQGTPMISMGDEVGRSQNGNNNAYCQDNPISWMNWDLLEENKHLLDFTKQLIQFKKKNSSFNLSEFLCTEPNLKHTFIQFHGIKLDEPDFGKDSHTLAFEIINKPANEHFFIILNMYWEDLDFQLPTNTQWGKVFDTINGFKTETYKNTYHSLPRSIAVFKKD